MSKVALLGKNGLFLKSTDTDQYRIIYYADLCKSKYFEFWKGVIFSNECKFNNFGPKGQHIVLRNPNEASNIKNIKFAVKHGGGSVSVWGWISSFWVENLAFIDGLFDSWLYLSIFKDNLHTSAD